MQWGGGYGFTQGLSNACKREQENKKTRKQTLKWGLSINITNA